jgi:hypothetical protein
MKYLRWERPEAPPKHPYRDTAILYAVFAAIIVIVTAITGGNLLPGGSARHGVFGAIARAGAVPVAAAFFVVATGYSWFRWRTHGRHQHGERRQP